MEQQLAQLFDMITEVSARVELLENRYAEAAARLETLSLQLEFVADKAGKKPHDSDASVPTEVSTSNLSPVDSTALQQLAAAFAAFLDKEGAFSRVCASLRGVREEQKRHAESLDMLLSGTSKVTESDGGKKKRKPKNYQDYLRVMNAIESLHLPESTAIPWTSLSRSLDIPASTIANYHRLTDVEVNALKSVVIGDADE